MTAPRRPGRPRSPRAHRAVLEAVIDLLGAHGLAGTSVDAVAARAGVSKATIYRHWRSKEALCAEAVACVVVEVPDAAEADVRRALEELLLRLADGLVRSDAGRLLPHLASVAATDPRLGEVWRQTLVEPARQRVAALLRRAVERGELGPDTDVDLAAELLLGPLYARRLLGGAPPVDRAFVERLTAAVWAAWGAG